MLTKKVVGASHCWESLMLASLTQEDVGDVRTFTVRNVTITGSTEAASLLQVGEQDVLA